MGLVKDNLYQDVVEESSEETAEVFFEYLYSQYHYQPQESLEECPELYDELSDMLDNKDYTRQMLYDLIDKYFLDILNEQRKKGIIAILDSKYKGENV